MNFFFFIFLGSKLQFHLKVIGLLIWFSHTCVYTYLALSNPGIPSFHNRVRVENNEEGFHYKYCSMCQLYYETSSNANHCLKCNVCIEGNIPIIILKYYYLIGWDHHCPWTTKCIGKGNILYFYLFLLLTLFLIVYYIIVSSNIDG